MNAQSIRNMLEQCPEIKVDVLLKRSIIVFGASNAGIALGSYLTGAGYEIMFYCDNDPSKQGKQINGIKVISPIDLKNFQRKDTIVCIASIGAKEIANQLTDIGIDYICLSYWDERWKKLFNREHILNSIPEILQAYNSLKDDISKDTFLSILKFRLTLDPIDLAISDYEHYFHPKLKYTSDDIIIDGGAYIGDTSFEIMDDTGGKCNIFAFEPDANNYQKLYENIQQGKHGNQIIPINAGLWKENHKGKLTADELSDRRYVAEEGTINIQLVKIDSFVNDRNIVPTVVKMDIEGSELPALMGAKTTIQKYRPKLIISALKSIVRYRADTLCV